MVFIDVFVLCLVFALCLILLIFIRVLFGCKLAIKATNLIHAYNQLCWLQNKDECCLDYDEAEKPDWYQILCPWVVTVRQCLTKDTWEKVKLVKNKEKEIIVAADEKYNKLCEEIERLKND